MAKLRCCLVIAACILCGFQSSGAQETDEGMWRQYIAQPELSPAWMNDFTGEIRIWTAAWLANSEGTSDAGALDITLEHHTVAEGFVETKRVVWEAKGWEAGPSFRYFVTFPASSTEVLWDGEPTVVYRTSPGTDTRSPLRRLFLLPFSELLLSKRVLGNMAFTSEQPTRDGLTLAHLASVNDSLREQMDISLMVSGCIYPVGFDSEVQAAEGKFYERDSYNVRGGRVLEYQTVQLGGNEIKAPRLLFMEEIASALDQRTMKFVGFRGRAILMYEVESHPVTQPAEDAFSLFPGQHLVIDKVNGRVYYKDGAADGTWLSNFVKGCDAESAEFAKYLTMNLKEAYPDAFGPLVTGENSTASPLGTAPTPDYMMFGWHANPVSPDELEKDVPPTASRLVMANAARPPLYADPEQADAGGGSTAQRRGFEPVTASEMATARRTGKRFGAFLLCSFLAGVCFCWPSGWSRRGS